MHGSVTVAERRGRVEATPVRSKRLTRILLCGELLLLDGLAVFVAFLFADALRGSIVNVVPIWHVGLAAAFTYCAFAVANDVFTWPSLSDVGTNAARSVTSLFYALVSVVCISFLAHAAETIPRLTFGAGALFAAAFLVGGRFIFQRYALARLSGSFVNELLIVDDAEIDVSRAEHMLSARAAGLRPDLNDPQMLERFSFLLHGFDRAVIACSPARRQEWSLLLRGANIEGEIVAPEFDGAGVIGVAKFDGHYTHVVSKGPLSTTNRAKKRALDLAIAIPVIIALSPVLALIAIAIKFDSPGPILFRQLRIGRGNRQFMILKFRSMGVEQSDVNGHRSASRDDDRVTRVGRFIRRTSLDELPQLLNVLIGDMSVVGPRPHALGSMAADRLFWEVDRRYWVRHALKPGITGLAQIRGFRGATERHEDLQNRLLADLEYLEGWNLMREIVIIAQTFRVLVHRNSF
jgi:polysaccharide biosynthesis protein PslA